MACTAGTHGHRDAAAALKELVAGMPVNILRTPAGGFVVRRTARATIATVGRGTRHARSTFATQIRRRAPPQVELAPIHVTGSRLPRTSVQTTLPVTIIDRDDILRSGYGSLFDLLRHLPGMNGHPAMSTSRSGDSQYLPVGAATTTSLDGMGRVRPCSWSMAGACHAIPWCRWNRVGSPILGNSAQLRRTHRAGTWRRLGHLWRRRDVRRGQHHPARPG